MVWGIMSEDKIKELVVSSNKWHSYQKLMIVRKMMSFNGLMNIKDDNMERKRLAHKKNLLTT
jgi:hypothetical protein